MKIKILCVFIDPEVIKCLKSLHDRYVIVPADNSPHNFIFVYEDYYYLKKHSLNLTQRCLTNAPKCTFYVGKPQNAHSLS